MTADVDLPLWTLSPNWSQDILERLQWLTNVLSSKESACEQRIALRINPRRSFEAMFTLEGAERTFADLWANRIGQGECMVPLWHDRGTLSAAAIGGATTLAVDTVDREFLAGSMALLVGPTPFTCEAVEIDTVADTTITLATPTVNTWPAGTVIHPLRRGRLDAETLSNLTTRAGASTLRFNIEGVDDGITGDDLPTYLGLPLLVTPPNWSDTIDTKMMWLSATRESDTGKTFIVDPAGRALPGQQHRWLLHGRAEQRAFRQMLYSLAGRARSLWLPTFAEDMTVTRAAASAATHLDVGVVGLGYVGGPAPGREHVLISGALATKVDSLDTPPSTTEERLVLHTGLSRAVAVGETLSFIDTSRLDQDEVEFVHHADSNGAAECTLVFRAFDASRDGSAAGALEIAEAEMSDTACGSPPISTVCVYHFQGYVTNWADFIATDAGALEGVHFNFNDYVTDALLTAVGHSYDDPAWPNGSAGGHVFVKFDASAGIFDVYLDIYPRGPLSENSNGLILFYSPYVELTVIPEFHARWRRESVSHFDDPTLLTVVASEDWHVVATADPDGGATRAYFALGEFDATSSAMCPGTTP